MSALQTTSTSQRNSLRFSQWRCKWTRRGSDLSKSLPRVRQAESQASTLDDAALLKRATEIREQADVQNKSKKRTANKSHELAHEMAGVIAEAVYRTFGFRFHDVQIHGMLAGYEGAVVEMQTGEGKTVVTGAMAALQSLNYPAVHVSTTNAYLAERDLQELVPVFERIGLTAGLLPDGNDVSAAQLAYQKHITYGPGYQFGFDYLRDQVVLRNNWQSDLGRKTLDTIRGDDISDQLMQTPHHFAMISDEADSVMIDEAVTPLVISGATHKLEDPTPYLLARKIAGGLVDTEDFTIELPDKKIVLEDEASERCHAEIVDKKNMLLERPWRIYLSNALRAHHVLRRDIDYVVLDGEIQIVDQNTGRIFSDRTWQDGLHQAVEAKEGVEIKSAANSVARITRQRYLQMYDQLAGLTGTAASVANEFKLVYASNVVPIPTNLPNQRQLLPARFFLNQAAKLEAIVSDVRARHSSGQPILIGTRTINESQQVASALESAAISAVLLNGMQDQDEAEIVGQAGQSGAITIATNMAGRGTDIKLNSAALEAGGLHVIGFSPNDSARIDRQLVGRAARQGNAGSAQFFVCPEDELLARYAPKIGQRITKYAAATGESRTSFANEIKATQTEVELKQFQVRQAMVRQDRWMDLVRESIEN